MRIESIEAIPLRISFRETFRFGTVDRTQSQNVVVRIRTDDGLVGYGEACPVPAFSGETQASVVELVEQRVRDLIVGEDPLHRRPLVRALERRLFGCPFTRREKWEVQREKGDPSPFALRPSPFGGRSDTRC